MSIEQKLNAQKEKIRKLEAEIEQCKPARQKCEGELAQCVGNLSVIYDARGKKKWGILWMLVAAALAVGEVLLLTEILPGSSNFQFIDLVIIGVPLFLGIKRLNAVKAAKKLGSANELERQRKQLNSRIAAYEQLDADLAAAKKELDQLTMYTGREWNMAHFVATRENIARMEQDAEAVFFTLQYSRGSHFMINNWISKNRLELANARLGKNNTLEKRIDEGCHAMGTAGSWKLQIVQLVMFSLNIVIMNVLFSGAMGKEMDLSEMLAKSNVRPPQTDEELDFYALALTGSAIINSTVQRELRNTIRR